MIRMSGIVFCVLLWAVGAGRTAEPFRFPEGKHGKGELKYVNGVPVLILVGTPEEMGEQMGVLGVRPAAKAAAVLKNLLKREKLDQFLPLLAKIGERQLAKYPDAYRREFEAMVRSARVDRDLLVIGNTFNELRHLAGCSGLMIAPGRSKTGGPLMGRNWDFPTVAGMHDYSMVIVYRPAGKRAFAVVSFPGSVAAGCLSSAMNADGLMIGGNAINQSADKAPRVDWQKTSNAVIARRILEECSTIAEAEKLIRETKSSHRAALVACDRNGGAVFEITSKTVAVRRGKDGICIGTNHFVSPELGVPTNCPRMWLLSQAARQEKLGVADVAKLLDAASQRAWTVHTMVFEPRALRLHVAFGDGTRSATTFPLTEIDLGKLLNPEK